MRGLLVVGGAVVISFLFGIPESPVSTLSILSNLLIFSLIAHIAVPQVVASLVLPEEARLVSSLFVNTLFWIVFAALSISIVGVIFGTALAEGATVSHLLRILFGFLGRTLAIRAIAALALGSLASFAMYAVWLLRAASSRRGFLALFAARIEDGLTHGDPSRSDDALDTLIAIGRETSSGHTRARVLGVLLDSSRLYCSIGSSASRTFLRRALSGIRDTFTSDPARLSLETIEETLAGLAGLVEQADVIEEFDCNHIVSVIVDIAQSPACVELPSVVLGSIQELTRIVGRQRIAHVSDPRIAYAVLAFKLESLSSFCLSHTLALGSVRIMNLFAQLLETANHSNTTEQTWHALCWHALSVTHQVLRHSNLRNLHQTPAVQIIWDNAGSNNGAIKYAEDLGLPTPSSVLEELRTLAKQ